MRCAVLTLAVSLLTISCARNRPARPDQAPETAADRTDIGRWAGVYASPNEIQGFSGTVLALEPGHLRDDLAYRMHFYSDVELAGTIDQEERSGRCLVDGDALYIPTASGFYHQGKPFLMAHVERYKRMTIKGHIVLMRGDAFRRFEEEGKLYDYGILIKVAETLPPGSNLRDVRHPSIKVLYNDSTKPWHDPFIHGPNDP